MEVDTALLHSVTDNLAGRTPCTIHLTVTTITTHERFNCRRPIPTLFETVRFNQKRSSIQRRDEMSRSAKDTQLQECYRIISNIARTISNKRATEIPLILLQLKPILSSKALSTKQLRKMKEYIWLNDLLHVNVETLRQDFTKVQGQWATAAQLASILSTICCGVYPKENPHTAARQSGYSEQRKEYYDILLPTSADSLLILANNLLEKEQQNVDSGYQVSELNHFRVIVESLLETCQSHRQCIERVLKSPYLLHLLITDLVHHCSVVLSFVADLVVIDGSLLVTLPPDVLHSLLDELVFKLSGEQEIPAVLSLELMARLATANHATMEGISSRYTGILELATKWNIQKRSRNIMNFISQLKALAITESEDAVHHGAATVIQAAWRGYSGRRRLKKMQRGIRKFQQIYRQRKAKKLKQTEEDRTIKTLRTAKQLNLKSQRLKFREKQLSTVEQLPASEIDRFVSQQENTAAVAIQAWWRGRLARAKCSKLHDERQQSRSVAVIQRAYRRYKRKGKSGSRDGYLLPQIEGAEREALQGEIAQYQEHHPLSFKSPTEVRELHDKVQNLTEKFYLSRIEQHKKDRERTELLSELDHSCDMLLRAPSLNDSFTMLDTPVTFTTAAAASSCGGGGGSAAVAKMAQTAHREELRVLNTPWWKRQALDSEDVLVLLS